METENTVGFVSVEGIPDGEWPSDPRLTPDISHDDDVTIDLRMKSRGRNCARCIGFRETVCRPTEGTKQKKMKDPHYPCSQWDCVPDLRPFPDVPILESRNGDENVRMGHLHTLISYWLCSPDVERYLKPLIRTRSECDDDVLWSESLGRSLRYVGGIRKSYVDQRDYGVRKYIRQIFRSVLLNWFKSRKSDGAMPPDLESGETTPDQSAVESERTAIVREVIPFLSLREQQLIQLYFGVNSDDPDSVHGIGNLAGVARQMELTYTQTDSLLRRTLKHVRRLLHEKRAFTQKDL